MSLDELPSLIQALQSANDADVQRAYAGIAELTRTEAAACAPMLAHALLAERQGARVHTPRLVTLLGMTRQPSPECLTLCLDLLRTAVSEEPWVPADALIGAAAVVARTEPRALLPDVAALAASPEAAPVHDQEIARVLFPLLSLTDEFLRELPDNGVTHMARWLWADCAALDLMSLADIVALHVEGVGAHEAIIELFVDVAERTRAGPAHKRYAADRLAKTGAHSSAVERLKDAWRAMAAAYPGVGEDKSSTTPLDPEPPAPDPRVDEYLAAFSEEDDDMVEYARAALDMLFDDPRPPFALPWWVAATVDAMPPWRRRGNVRWALLRASDAVRGFGDRISNIPPSILLRWLDTPQLLNATDTWIAVDLLGRQRPDVLVQKCLHRAVAASSGAHPEIALGDMWRTVTRTEPSAVLLLVSRWVAAGLGKSALLTLLISLLMQDVREHPEVQDELAQAVSGETAPNVSEIARQLLAGLRDGPADNETA